MVRGKIGNCIIIFPLCVKFGNDLNHLPLSPLKALLRPWPYQTTCDHESFKERACSIVPEMLWKAGAAVILLNVKGKITIFTAFTTGRVSISNIVLSHTSIFIAAIAFNADCSLQCTNCHNRTWLPSIVITIFIFGSLQWLYRIWFEKQPSICSCKYCMRRSPLLSSQPWWALTFICIMPQLSVCSVASHCAKIRWYPCSYLLLSQRHYLARRIH